MAAAAADSRDPRQQQLLQQQPQQQRGLFAVELDALEFSSRDTARPPCWLEVSIESGGAVNERLWWPAQPEASTRRITNVRAAVTAATLRAAD